MISKKSKFFFKSQFEFRWRTIIIPVVCVLTLGGLGYLIDLMLATKPLFFVLCLILALPATQLLTYYVFKHYTNNKLWKV